MTHLTVCLLNWRRLSNTERILESLGRQTIRPCVFLWDNSGNLPSYYPHRIDWLVKSGQNLRCWPRWFMASQADTPFVMSLDDDLDLADERVLADLVDQLEECDDCDRILGREGVILLDGHGYTASNAYGFRCGPDADGPAVDIVKGRLMALRRSALESVPMHWRDTVTEDDIAVSGLLAKHRPLWHRVVPWLRDRTVELPDPDALWRMPAHFQRRDQAVRCFFPWHSWEAA